MTIELTALDTVFFRDGKPFTMGEETLGNTIFPPMPSVIYGALRTAYFAENPTELSKANEADDPTSHLRITQILLKSIEADGSDGSIFLPLPLDLVENKDKEDDKDKKEVFFLQKEAVDSGVCSNNAATHILAPTTADEVKSVERGLLTKNSIAKYIEGKNITFSYSTLSDFLTNEPKVGIGLNRNTRAVEEGKLYTANMQRLQNKEAQHLTMIVSFENLNIKETGVLRIGGEGKTVAYKSIATANIPKPVSNSNIVKFYLTTPAVFKLGWQPEWLAAGNYQGIAVKLVTHTIGKPLRVGGFDMKSTKHKEGKYPKPMRKAVPAGSVYYIECAEPQQLIDALHGQSIAEYDLDKQGFGLVYCANAI